MLIPVERVGTPRSERCGGDVVVGGVLADRRAVHGVGGSKVCGLGIDARGGIGSGGHGLATAHNDNEDENDDNEEEQNGDHNPNNGSGSNGRTSRGRLFSE